jgi:hypothetical protein
MATDAIVVANTQLVRIDTMAMTPIVQLAPMQPGRSYVVWASGTLHIETALVDVELEAFDAKNTIQLAGSNDIQSYSLAVGTILPADDDLFTVAKVSAAVRDTLGEGDRGSASTIDGRLVVLAVDSVTLQTV